MVASNQFSELGQFPFESPTLNVEVAHFRELASLTIRVLRKVSQKMRWVLGKCSVVNPSHLFIGQGIFHKRYYAQLVPGDPVVVFFLA